jgi:geranylgeranyl diphosphate synthase type I
VPAAVAIGLIHEFSLLHDDVMDGDETRRHRPTAWTVFGTGEAILVGDALLALGLRVIATSGHATAREGVSSLSKAVFALTDGQMADLAFESRDDVTLAEVESMAQKKTSALIGVACALGAGFGGAGPEAVEHFRGFGERLGLAFQHVDDLLGIWGDPSVTGKPVHADLARRKKSLPVMAALRSGSPARAELAELYRGDKSVSDADLGRAAALVEAAGGRAWSLAEVDRLWAGALEALDAARPSSRARAELHELAELVVRRDH